MMTYNSPDVINIVTIVTIIECLSSASSSFDVTRYASKGNDNNLKIFASIFKESKFLLGTYSCL